MSEAVVIPMLNQGLWPLTAHITTKNIISNQSLWGKKK